MQREIFEIQFVLRSLFWDRVDTVFMFLASSFFLMEIPNTVESLVKILTKGNIAIIAKCNMGDSLLTSCPIMQLAIIMYRFAFCR